MGFGEEGLRLQAQEISILSGLMFQGPGSYKSGCGR